MIKTLELKGYESYRALHAFHKLMLGLKMLPMYSMFSYEEFYSRVDLMSDIDKEKLIREAALFVTLEQDELDPLFKFASDPNGVPYCKENMKSLTPDMIFEIKVQVCMRISRISVNFLTPAEKKNSEDGPLIQETTF